MLLLDSFLLSPLVFLSDNQKIPFALQNHTILPVAISKKPFKKSLGIFVVGSIRRKEGRRKCHPKKKFSLRACIGIIRVFIFHQVILFHASQNALYNIMPLLLP